MIISSTVNARDTNPPVVTSCPTTSTYSVPLGTTSTIVTWTEPSATDDSGVAPTVVVSHRSGSSFPIGTTQVAYIFRDDAGNEATCTFSVIGNWI